MRNKLFLRAVSSVVVTPIVIFALIFGNGVFAASTFMPSGEKVYEGYVYPGHHDDFDVPRARERVAQVERKYNEVDRHFQRAQQHSENLRKMRNRKASEVDRAGNRLSSLREEISGLERQLKNLRNERKAKLVKIKDNRNVKIPGASRRLEAAKGNLSKKRAQAVELQGQISSLEQQIQKLQAQARRVCQANPESQKCANLKNQLSEKKKRIEVVRGLSRDVQKAIVKIEANIQKISQRIEALRAENVRLQKEIKKINHQVDTGIPAEIQKKRARASQLRNRLGKLKRELRDLGEQFREAGESRAYWKRELESVSLRLERATENLYAIQRNFDRARRHGEESGHYFASIDGVREGEEKGSPDGDASGRDQGRETGNREGIASGRGEARRVGTEIGKQQGTGEGRRDGTARAEREGIINGNADGWRMRGYDDGHQNSSTNPDTNDSRYKSAYASGKNEAYQEAHGTHYPLGVEEANGEYYGATLEDVTVSNLDSVLYGSEDIGLIENFALPRMPFVSPPETRDLASTSGISSAVPVFSGSVAAFSAGSSVSPYSYNYSDDFFLPIPAPNPQGNSQSWSYRYYRSGKVTYPHHDLQRHFEDVYRSEYALQAIGAYDSAFTRSYYETFKFEARQAYDQVSDPSLYPSDQEDARKKARAHWYGIIEKSTFDELYPGIYEGAKERAYNSPDTSTSEYKNGYESGTGDALTARGREDGYKQNIAQARIDEKKKGYTDRSNYFRENADLKVTVFATLDENEDSIFATGETFDFNVAIENYGLKGQMPGSLNGDLRIYSGPARGIVETVEIIPLKGRSRTQVKHVLKGKIDRDAIPGERVKGEISIRYMDGGQPSVLGTFSFDFTLRTPMEFGNVLLGSRSFTNRDNILTGTIKNVSSKSSPSSVTIALLNDNLESGALTTLPPIKAGESKNFTVRFEFNESLLFERAKMKLEARSQDILQAKTDSGETFVTKGFQKTSDALLVNDDFTKGNWRPVRDALWSASSKFDIFDLSVEKANVTGALKAYRNGFVFINSNKLESKISSALSDLLTAHTEIFVSGDGLQGDSHLSKILKKRNIEFKGRADPGVFEGEHIFTGNGVRVKGSSRLKSLKLSTFWGVFSGPKFLNYELLKKQSFPEVWKVGARSIDFKGSNFSAISVFTFNLNRLKAMDAGLLVEQMYLLSLPVEEKIDLLCEFSGKPGNTDAVLKAILYELFEEIQADKLLGRKEKLYNPKYNDIRETSLYIYQDEVLSNPGCSFYRVLVELYKHIDDKVSDNSDAKKILKRLAKVYWNE